jgi:hypothetical protein
MINRKYLLYSAITAKGLSDALLLLVLLLQ